MLAYGDNNAEVAIIDFNGNERRFLLTFGEQVAAIPSGTYTYNGTNIAGISNGSLLEFGTFSMTVNFTSSTAALTGSTESTIIGGNNISVNTSDGTFTGDALTLKVSDEFDAFEVPAAIQGNFHGTGATGITGLYYDTYTSTPAVNGAIAGTRE